MAGVRDVLKKRTEEEVAAHISTVGVELLGSEVSRSRQGRQREVGFPGLAIGRVGQALHGGIHVVNHSVAERIEWRLIVPVFASSLQAATRSAMRSSKRLAAQEAQAALSDHGLELILREHKPDQLAKALIVHYKNTATCRIRSKEYPRFPIRLAAKLHKSADPPSFIIDTLCELSSHFRDILDPSECFDKLLAQMCIEALEEYAQESRRSFERAKGPNIVSSSSLLVRLGISSSTSANQPSTVITLAHQQRCLSLIPTIPSPKLLAIAIIPFNLKSLLSAPADPEPAGVLLIRRLFEHKNCKDAIFTLKFLGLERFFSMQQIIVPLLEMNYLKEVINLCKNDRTKGTEFLDFVNAQLSHKFVGGVEVVTDGL